ncbi:unnamed protein product [Blepharisma stoltei]|uniref:C2H2-type domain-containing protein n=1 Tax=Blepharisma stoltei TaxID=1481888 RepID=A0AAU9JPR6_9CILI|nr:unnamed protein product [Blepharisma stoltei]
MKDTIYKCKVPGCTSSYSNKFNLKRHMEAYHSENKKFQCRFCTKVLSSKQNLKEHIFTHSGEMPYNCKEPGCGMKFRQGSQLSAHKRIHLALNKYTQKSEINHPRNEYIILTQLIEKSDFFKLEAIPYKLNANEEHRYELPPISAPQEYCMLPTSIFSSQIINQ